jgi:hypothetical protein
MKTQKTDQVICRTYDGQGRCWEVTLAAKPSSNWRGRKYIETVDGQVPDARTCWLTDEDARARYDAAAHKIGERP